VKKFNIPEFYRSPVISRLKLIRTQADPGREDYAPSRLDFGPVVFLVPRHFGFCYGVENAIEISFRALDENPGKNIFLLSQMIHNPDVNKDLMDRGVKFLMDTEGNEILPRAEVKAGDVLIVPAFGAPVADLKWFEERGVDVKKYDTTCPFVERVWNKSKKLGDDNFTIVIHGKFRHEETRATFSRSVSHGPSIVVLDLKETDKLRDFILGKISKDDFFKIFGDRVSDGFDPDLHLSRIGVINQTTMLASETQAIASRLKEAMIQKYGPENIKSHFADTRDTLCYATNQNQDATIEALENKADMAVVVGGYNSSNTSHLVELCEEKFPTFFISGPDEILGKNRIRHFDFHSGKLSVEEAFLPDKTPLTLVLTGGASVPDSVVEGVMARILSFYEEVKPVDQVLKEVLPA
jgi:4-hydroxy-3-methylbut-2-en-1-yl diphosphate reductase